MRGVLVGILVLWYCCIVCGVFVAWYRCVVWRSSSGCCRASKPLYLIVNNFEAASIVFEFLSPNGLAATPIASSEVAALTHETLDDAMKLATEKM